MNQIFLKGRLTKEVEITIGTKTPYCRFSLAIPRKGAKRPNGEPDYTSVDYCNVTAFGKTAERLCENTRKGDTIFVDGNLSWYKKIDQPYPIMTVNATSIMIDTTKTNADYLGASNSGGDKKSDSTNNGDDYFADSDDYVSPPFDL